MNRILRFINQIYGLLIKLFPPEFQAEFGDELQGVFSTMVGTAAGKSKLALAATCLRELRDFPIFLLRTHLEKNMKTPTFSQPARFAFRGALGFSLGFTLYAELWLSLIYWLAPVIHRFNNFLVGNLILFAIYGLASMGGGVLFALLFNGGKGFIWFAAAAMLAWFIPQAVSYGLHFLDWDTALIGQQSNILSYFSEALWGAFYGLIICMAKNGRGKLLGQLAIGAVLYPVLAFGFPQLLLHYKIPSPALFIGLVTLMVVFLAGVVWMASRADKKVPWLVIAAAVAYPFIIFLWQSMVLQFHLFLSSPVGLQVSSIAPIASFPTSEAVNVGIGALPEGILFGGLLGLILSWRRRSPQSLA